MASTLTLKPDFAFVINPKYKTQISAYENGVEQRRQKWAAGLTEWQLVYRNRASSDLSTLQTVFDNAKGSYTAFTWDEPIAGATKTVRFKEDSLTIEYVAYGIYNISFNLIEVK